MATHDSTISYAPIPGFPGYRVGTDGSIWSRWVSYPGGSRMANRWRRMKATVKKGRSAGRAYRYLNLCRDGKSRTFNLHCLVLLAFVGPCPASMECRHADGDPGNNRLDNLSWGTPEQNRDDCRRHGRYQRGNDHSQAKLTEADVRLIRSRYAAGGVTLRELADDFDVSLANIQAIVTRRSWQHI